jgi:hypothetical protein
MQPNAAIAREQAFARRRLDLQLGGLQVLFAASGCPAHWRRHWPVDESSDGCAGLCKPNAGHDINHAPPSTLSPNSALFTKFRVKLLRSINRINKNGDILVGCR